MIINKIILFLLLFLGFISKKLSITNRYNLGVFIGFLLRILDSKRKNITLDNISKAFPDKPYSWHYSVMKESYSNLGITLVELITFDTISEPKVRQYIKYENIDHAKELFSKGKGLIFISGHFGNWELGAFGFPVIAKIPFMIIVKPQKNNLVDEVLNSYRIKSGNSVVSMYNSARDIIKTLRSGGALALLADQSATKDKDVFVNFFNRPAATYESPADLALRFNIPILMGFAVRQKDYTYIVKLVEVKHDDLTHNKEGILELTQRHVKMLEDAIRENPGHWAWQHRRWKHSPPNDIN
jgi:Kdo2-lipid IVA lauroyltransferase/acyltransferase